MKSDKMKSVFVALLALMLLTILASILITKIDTIYHSDIPYSVLMTSQAAISIGTFLVASMVAVFVAERKVCGADLNWSVDIIYTLMAMGVIFISQALVEWASFANWQLLSLPQLDWLKNYDFTNYSLTARMLSTDTPMHTIIAVVVVAILPAICEEFFFRGVILRGLLSSIGNKTIAICSSALFFSMLHMDVNGFLPRIVLGIILGILYVQSKGIFQPIMAHAFNNGLVIISCALSAEPIEKILSAELTNPGPLNPILSVILIIWLLQFMNSYQKMKIIIDRLLRKNNK